MNTDDDRTMLILTLPILFLLLGPGILASFLPDVRALLLEADLLVDENVVIPIADGVGLDAARIVILCGLLIALLTLGAVGIKRLHARRDEKATR
ncbi:hypothetical protein [Microbacterium rhizomatis]|uniref:Uncharacterized protein n=1 Tax=Microbacterium rhizomatis TaxID=1631477 RepID=A0A5J5J003_9MICO|nr:hypothetical protein [Microbacterium rhizomatis]KAA9105998.1 hypothetical protein F6B43_16705 [Microbacterium rhizomatis]